MHLGSGSIHHERRCSRATLSLYAGLRELGGVLEKTDAAGMCETQQHNA